jgi:hypothetical protein
VTNAELLREAGSPDAAQPPGTLAAEPELAGAPLRPAEWRASVWFNPWTYQNHEQVWAGLAHAIITQVTDRLEPGDRERFWLRLNLARLDRLAVRRRAYRLFVQRLAPPALMMLVALLAAAGLWVTGLAREAAGWLATGGASAFAALGALRYLTFRTQPAAAGFGKLLAAPAANGPPDGLLDELFPDPGYTARAGFLHLVQDDVASVLALVADQQRPLVVFVDDLDRCSPRVVSQVIEALNLFLAGDFENCVFVLAMEPDLVAAHVEVAYGDMVAKLRERGQADRIGWRFLDKIVQLPISLPPVDRARDLPRYLRALLDLPPDASDSTTGSTAGPVPDAAPLLTPAVVLRHLPGPLGAPVPIAVPAPRLIDQAEAMIRACAPTAESLPEITHRVERVVLLAPAGIPGPALAGELTGLVARAADRVYADLLGDRSAYAALTAGLPSLGSVSPREVKRYLNLFRFYAFIAFRRRLDRQAAPDLAQIAKLAAIAVRWPYLLGQFASEDGSGTTALQRWEDAARSDDDGAWQVAGGDAVDPGLRAVLGSGPLVAQTSRGFI